MKLLECWIMDGNLSPDCGGDGDYDHDSFALEGIYRAFLEAINQEYDEYLLCLDGLNKYITAALSDAGIEWDKDVDDVWQVLDDHMDVFPNLDRHLVVAVDNPSSTDAKAYAMQYFNWKRLGAHQVSTWRLTREDFRQICDGVAEAVHVSGYEDDDDFLEMTQDYAMTIWVGSTGNRYSLTLAELLARDSSLLQLESFAMSATQSDQVRRLDLATMSPVYKNKIGD